MRLRSPVAPRTDTDRRDPIRGPREIFSELRKVTWPSREEAVRLTIMVIIVSAAIGAILGVVDYVFSLLVTQILVGA
ncbi:MAG: preprotein translocase subunit SecE [Chloroflexi bacterium]|nr:preprotein translocase subunit SecE [Chloroflexota bacterium]